MTNYDAPLSAALGSGTSRHMANLNALHAAVGRSRLRHALLALYGQPRTFEETAPQQLSLLVQPNLRAGMHFDLFANLDLSSFCGSRCSPDREAVWNRTRVWTKSELEATIRTVYGHSDECTTGHACLTVRHVHTEPGAGTQSRFTRWLAILRAADAARRAYDVYIFCRTDVALLAPCRVADLVAHGPVSLRAAPAVWNHPARAHSSSHAHSSQQSAVDGGGGEAGDEHHRDFLRSVTGTLHNTGSFVHSTDVDYIILGSRRCLGLWATLELTPTAEDEEMNKEQHPAGGGPPLAAPASSEEAAAKNEWSARLRQVAVTKHALDRMRNATGLRPDKPYLLGAKFTRSYYRRQLLLYQEGCAFDVGSAEEAGVRAEMVRPGGVRIG